MREYLLQYKKPMSMGGMDDDEEETAYWDEVYDAIISAEDDDRAIELVGKFLEIQRKTVHSNADGELVPLTLKLKGTEDVIKRW